MTQAASLLTDTSRQRAGWRDYLELCKPKVVSLMLITALVGMYLATPHWLPLGLVCSTMIGIGLTASAAAVVNHYIDRRIDTLMRRTYARPIAAGRVAPKNALVFAVILAVLGLSILAYFVNSLTAWLSFATLLGYAGVYTMYLKRATPQNIVIGGAAGAAPPLLGWVAVTGHIAALPLLLVLIIFTWTPPHFWALAIYRYDDYAKARIPMLPVTHGIPFCKLAIVLYTCLLVAVSVLPFAIGKAGWLYLAAALVLGLRFLYWSVYLWRTDKAIVAMRTFKYSIVYLFALFIFLLVDHYFVASLLGGA